MTITHLACSLTRDKINLGEKKRKDIIIKLEASSNHRNSEQDNE